MPMALARIVDQRRMEARVRVGAIGGRAPAYSFTTRPNMKPPTSPWLQVPP